ncbi:hypothetical protein CVT26_006824 [Gymnopilus dilepis]|uniref:Uncharacterized protein n=1 Tax=Gymnopilus dilepis TaxID=231916 RepID=A0A409VMY8_9AGAR|nr:hypothetical protein CVT26_006824 [Gymnopilus dilepis]
MSHEPDNEYVLNARSDRLTLFPIEFHALWRYYRHRVTSSQGWALDAITFDKDMEAWANPPSLVLRHTIVFYLELMLREHKRMFDGLLYDILGKVTCPEVRCLLELFLSKENVHADTIYRAKKAFAGAIPDDELPPFIYDDDDLERLLADKLTFTSVHDHPGRSAVDGLLCLASAKSVFSFSIYSVLQWVLDINGFRLPGLLQLVSRLQQDADSIVYFVCLVLCHMPRRPSYEQLSAALSKAVDIEQEFAIRIVTPADVDPLSVYITHDSLKDYIIYVAHTFYQTLGHVRWINRQLVYPWMNHTEGRAVAFMLELDMEQAYSEELSLYTNLPQAGKGLINDYYYPPEDHRRDPVTSEDEVELDDSADDDYDMAGP